MAIWTAPPMWAGGTAFVIGGGSSLLRIFEVPDHVAAEVADGRILPDIYSPYLAPLHDKHIIGINNAYMLGPWVDCTFFGDCGWYAVHRLALAKIPNLKVSCCPRFQNRQPRDMEGVKFLRKDPDHRLGVTDDPSRLAWNSNSGGAAINLAIHFGARMVVLLGFDMCMDPTTKRTHWHQGHGNKNPPPFQRHLRGFPHIAKEAGGMGVEVVNCSPISVIQEFRKVGLNDVL